MLHIESNKPDNNRSELMTDKTKKRLAIVFLICSFILPLVGLAIGWIRWDFKTGAIVAVLMFSLFLLLSGMTLGTVRNMSWFMVSLPFLLGLSYSLLPNFLIGPIDDTAVVAAGARLSFRLALRKHPATAKWMKRPLLTTVIYTLVGSLVPGSMDELVVAAIAFGVAKNSVSKQLSSSLEDISIDAEVVDSNVLADS